MRDTFVKSFDFIVEESRDPNSDSDLYWPTPVEAGPADAVNRWLKQEGVVLWSATVTSDDPTPARIEERNGKAVDVRRRRETWVLVCEHVGEASSRQHEPMATEPAKPPPVVAEPAKPPSTEGLTVPAVLAEIDIGDDGPRQQTYVMGGMFFVPEGWKLSEQDVRSAPRPLFSPAFKPADYPDIFDFVPGGFSQ